MNNGSWGYKPGMALSVLGLLVGAGSIITPIGPMITGNNEDSKLENDIRNYVVQIESDLAKSSYVDPKKSIEDFAPTDIRNPLSSSNTSIEVSGMVQGYCIRGKNVDGHQSKVGIVYASTNGQFSDSQGCLNGQLVDYRLADEMTVMVEPKTGKIPNALPEDEEGYFERTPLYFGLGGVLAAGGYALSANSSQSRRREEALESIEVSAEVTTMPKPSSRPVYSGTGSWAALIQRYESVREAWASYELDPVKLIELPVITNMSNPVTEKFHRALREAKYLRPVNAKDVKGIQPNGSPFAKAVTELEHCFDVMMNEAKRIRWAGLSDKEQSSLKTAQALLNIAMNSAATVHERQAAYKRLLKEVQGIILIRKDAMLAIENRILQSIES